MAASREMVEDPVARVTEEQVYVAVGKNFKECKSLLLWAINDKGWKRICIIHVHQPVQMIPFMGAKFHASSLKEEEVEAYREIERQETHKMLDEYIVFCRRMGVRPERLHIEKESIEEGILELISQHGIRRLVMGAASDAKFPSCGIHYKITKRSMTDIKSKKAISVRLQAPASCHIWFICRQHLVFTKQGTADVNDAELSSNQLRSQSVALGQNNFPKLTNPAPNLLHTASSLSFGPQWAKASTSTSPDNIRGPSARQSTSVAEKALSVSSDECGTLLSSTSQDFILSTSSSSGMVSAELFPPVRTEGSEIGPELSIPAQLKENLCHSSPLSVLDGSIEDYFYDHFEQAMTEAANSRREAYEEADRRAKAETDAIEAICRVKPFEDLYAEESRQRKETEEALAKQKDELEKMKSQRDEAMEELHNAIEKKSLLERKIADSNQSMKELEQKIISAVELLQSYRKERHELQMERDNALKEAEELRKSCAESSSSYMPQFFSEFSYSEIEEATHNLDLSCKIGEGGYGSIFKGFLRQTQVAIKVLHSHSLQGPSEFKQEVDVLSNTRHPNLVTLIGTCPEACTLVYEYLPNGSLEDRLSCRGSSPPLSWQTRIRIATELCSVLIFLHSSKPHSIVHGDLKPANVLLDANFVSKLSDFGICRLLSRNEGSSNNTTICCRTDPKGTLVYMDPEFLSSGELTPKSDVYSFGIILLRLLTGRPALGIIKEVQNALEKGDLKNILDPLAGDWPFVQAEQVAYLALRCCEMSRKSRPDLELGVWKVLKPMKASCGGSSCFRLGSEEHCQPPTYFKCPIFQEIMRDPHVAADGFTYEAEAIRGWLDSGHDTSPMTNENLPHCNLVPNHALRSAILEWLQEQ